ncbi:MAG: late competence development ComFB family protein [Anaerolineae bacterium]|nr:late competence development ComFB family protein [Gloeobacterales cyanobacterium ES-bin-313]
MKQLTPDKSAKKNSRRKRYVNVMEQLVRQETERQHAELPEYIQQKLDCTDVEAWALNHLPARYATGVNGVQVLKNRLLDMYQELITITVQQAIEVVTRNSRPPGDPYLPGNDDPLFGTENMPLDLGTWS